MMKSLSRYMIVFIIFSVAFICFILEYLSSQWIISTKVRLNDVHSNNNYDELTTVISGVQLSLQTNGDHKDEDANFGTYLKRERLQEMVLAVVACGDRLDETLIMIKSAILFSKSSLEFIVVADDHLIPSFKEKLNEWRMMMNESFTFRVLPVTFPLQGNVEEWRRLFKPCASQRLFLPTVLSDVDALLYVDTDTLFLGPLEDVWRHFDSMNDTQMAALTQEHEDPNTGWYNRFARHPYYGKLGVNSGVMLMNLTRMRAFSWVDYVVPIYKQYKLFITWGDQDIINIIFHFHPDKLYVYPCHYNYRPDHCMYMSVCRSAEQFGVAVLHGSRSSFHGEKQPAFRAVYRAMEELQLGSNPYMNLYLPMRNYLDQTRTTNCGKIGHIFTDAMQRYFHKPDSLS